MPLRFSIRFRLSTVLLLSALNSVAMAAVAIVSFTAVIESPSPEVIGAVKNVQSLVETAHDAALTGDLSDPETARRIDLALDAVPEILGRLPERLHGVESEFQAYQAASDAWVEAVRRRPGGDPATDPVLAPRLADLRLSHRHLVGTAQLAISYQRPPWVDQVIPLLPLGMAWLLFVSGVTVVAAWSLRAQLSRPLEALASSAAALAGGDLDVRIPRYDDVPEIGVLSQAMRAARDKVIELLAEQEARVAREKTVFQHMSDGVLLCAADGVVLQLNPRAEQLLWQLVPSGVEPRPGHPVHRLVREITPELLETGSAATLEAARTPPGQEQVRGATTWVQLSLRPIPARPGPSGARSPASWVVVLRDVTQERELESLQREFLSVVTHELKTPLTAIEGYARLLERGKAGELQPRQLDFVRTISDQSGVLKAMVQNLLDTSRLEGGSLPIHRQEVELGALLRELAETWRGGAAQRELELDLDLRGDAPIHVEVDPFRVQQVVGNLVGNALKFTERGGRITLRALRAGRYAAIEVEDTGRGIPPDKLDRVFDKFFQVARGDTRVAGGTGLGLYICRQLVQAMGGTITVRSEERVGSCFTIRFPVVEVAAGPPARPPQQEAT